MQHGDPYINKGLKALKANAVEQAVSLFQESVNYSPSVDGYHMLGMALHKLNDIEGALKALSQSIELSPQNSTLYLDRGQVLMSCLHFDLAERDLSLAILLNKRNEEAYFRRGLLHLELSNYNKAEKDLKTAISLNPDQPFFIGGLGKLYMAKKEYATAIETFQDALSVEPDFFEALRLIGEAYIGLEDFDQAIFIYKKCVILDPNADGIILRLGWLYSQINDLPHAFECFYTISQRYPFNFKALLPSVRDTFDKASWKRFEKDLDAKLSSGNQDIHDVLSMAIAQECLHEEKLALHFYERSLNKKQLNVLAASRLVELSIAYSTPSTALPVLKHLHKAHPEHKDITYLYARLNEHIGQNELAVELFQAVIDLDSDYYLAYFHRGNLYIKQKQYDLAKADLKACLMIKKHFAPCYFSLSRLFGLQNKFKQGLKMINMALKIDKRSDHYVQKAKLYIGLDNMEKAKQNVELALKKNPDCESAKQLASFLR